MEKKLSKKGVEFFNSIIIDPESTKGEKKLAQKVLERYSSSKEIPKRSKSSAKKSAANKTTSKEEKKPAMSELQMKKLVSQEKKRMTRESYKLLKGFFGPGMG